MLPDIETRGTGRRHAHAARQCATAFALLILGVLVLVTDLGAAPVAVSKVIEGPYSSLLAASTDLGPARTDRVRLTAALRRTSRPAALISWAHQNGLSVGWRPGDPWAVVEGVPAAVASAFNIDVHDYRGLRGQVFYAARQQPAVPDPLRGDVAELGRILGYTPYHEARRFVHPLSMGSDGLRPDSLLRVYGAEDLSKRGFTGKGVTVVVFAFDGFYQTDLDMFSTSFGLSKFTPDVVGEIASERSGEATMDLEIIHALAPDAKTVLVDARPTVRGDATYQKIANLMESVDRSYPGAIWSFSIGWGCDKLVTGADLVPVRAAMRKALSHGTTAFDASGDLAGLECKGGQDWSAPPSLNDVGLDAVASVPEMTSVGGTTLSTDANGNRLDEQAWFDVPLSQGTGGGVSSLFQRPSWQDELTVPQNQGQRLTPDVSAVASPESGVMIVLNQQTVFGGGTSLSAPVWAGLTAVMNQYLKENGGRPLGDINPMLYEVAQGARLPAFHSIALGGNAIDVAAPGYDLVTGLGSPDIGNLVQDLLIVQGET